LSLFREAKYRKTFLITGLVLLGFALGVVFVLGYLSRTPSGGLAGHTAVLPPVDPPTLPGYEKPIESSPTTTDTASPTSSPTPTASPASTSTHTLTPRPQPTRRPTQTRRPRRTAPPTHTPAPTATPSPTPLPTPDGQKRTTHVPILMYHHIATPPPGADAVRRDLSVSPARFEEQLRYLKENGYQSVTLRDLVYHLALGWPLPERPVILTFDDGYLDVYTYAYPLLKKHGFVATFFLVTAPIDQENPEYVTWDQVALMHEGGMEFGAHSYTHPDLRDKPVDYIVWQVVGSKEAIEARTQEPVRVFSYPSGAYDQLVVDVLRSAHFWAAVTIGNGGPVHSDGLFEIPRIRIRGGDSMDRFVRKLEMDR